MNNKKYNKIAVIFGGFSPEREVSLNSGIAITSELSKKYQVLPIEITRDKKFRIVDLNCLLWMGQKNKFIKEGEIWDLYQEYQTQNNPESLQKLDFINILDTEFWKSSGVDVCFLALHGEFGEDGGIQSILDLVDMPYIGSKALASAIGMNKQLSNTVVSQAGVRTIKSYAFKSWENKDEVLKNTWIGEYFESGKYIFAKPLSGGSSTGTALLKTKSDFLNFNFSIDYLLQEYIVGREFTVPIIGFESASEIFISDIFDTSPTASNKAEIDKINLEPDLEIPQNPNIMVLLENQGSYRSLKFPVIEIISENNFDYFDKYLSTITQELCPADISLEITRELQKYALLAHKAIGCLGLTRSDFLVTDDNQIYYLETNTIPGCTAVSLIKKSPKTAGYSFTKFLEIQLDIAMIK